MIRETTITLTTKSRFPLSNWASNFKKGNSQEGSERLLISSHFGLRPVKVPSLESASSLFPSFPLSSPKSSLRRESYLNLPQSWNLGYLKPYD